MHQSVVEKNAGLIMSDLQDFINAQKYNIRANIETSTRCTLRCPQCTRISLQHPKNTNRYKEIKQRITNGFDLEISEAEKLLKFFSDGLMLCGSLSDPVFWPNFFDFLRLTNNYPNSVIQIHTAASQQNLEWYKKAFRLCHKNIIWRFGIDGMTDTGPIYRVGQNTSLMFETMMLAKSMNISVQWQFIIFEHNQHQINEAKNFSKINNIEILFVKSNRVGGSVTVPNHWKPKRNKETINENSA